MYLFLAQSDTTAGFLSKSKNRILSAKQNSQSKPILAESNSLDLIKKHSRIPQKINKAIRRSKKTTFIFQNNKSFRLVCDNLHSIFLGNFGLLYSSSANLYRHRFDLNFAINSADILIMDKRGIFETTPSKIFKIRKDRIKKIR